MNAPTISSVAAGLICRMIRDRAFGMASSSVLEHSYLLDDAALHSLIHALCASYDTLQYNTEDEVLYKRKELVETIANCVSMSPNQLAFVTPSTALAFAFHPTTRRCFISFCCLAQPSDLDRLFVNSSYKSVAKAWAAFVPGADGHLHSVVLRDLYWGRDFDEHVVRFLRANLPPYAATWHSTEALTTRYHSLVLAPVVRPFLSTLAEVARRSLLKRDNVSMCGKFFHADPLCGTQPYVNEGVLVARTLQIDNWLQPRICPHFGMTAVLTEPSTTVERICAAEMLICTLAPLALPPYVLLEIVSWLIDLAGYQTRFIGNVCRVHSMRKRLRRPQHKRAKDECSSTSSHSETNDDDASSIRADS